MVDGAPSPATRLRNAARSFRDARARLGWLNAVLYSLDVLAGRITGSRMRLHKYYLVAQPVSTKRFLAARRGAGIEVRRVGAADPIVKEFPRPAWAAPYRFDQGAICLAALRADRCIAFWWCTLGPYQEDEVRCRYIPLPEGKSAWDFDVYVEPEHRTGIAFLKLWDEANCFLAEREFQWTLSRISAYNSGSISSHARFGTRRIGTATFLCVGSWQLAVATVPPYLHISTRPESFPVYALHPGPAATPDL